jgi:predicted aspartyl protease
MKYKFNLINNRIIVVFGIKTRRKLHEYNFLLDTGATVTIIDKSIADMLGYKQNTDDMLRTVGGNVSAKTMKLPSIFIFGKPQTNFTVKVIDFSSAITVFADGIVGMDVLSQFSHIDIDFNHNTIDVA